MPPPRAINLANQLETINFLKLLGIVETIVYSVNFEIQTWIGPFQDFEPRLDPITSWLLGKPNLMFYVTYELKLELDWWGRFHEKLFFNWTSSFAIWEKSKKHFV
jgi:hypothetical protein